MDNLGLFMVRWNMLYLCEDKYFVEFTREYARLFIDIFKFTNKTKRKTNTFQ